MPTIQPSLQIALQDGFCTAKTNLSNSIFGNNVVVAGASACSSDLSLAEFNAVAADEIKSMFLGCKMGFEAATFAGMVVLDIESPIPPQQWYLQNEAFFASIKLRIDTIRGVLPKAKLGLYGVVYAPYLGQVNGTGYPGGKTWATGPLAGYKMAAAAHVFDSLDYLCPVCPAVWGPGDTIAQQTSVLPSVIVAINQTAALGTGKLISPFIRWKIYSTASKANEQHAAAQVLIEQICAATATRQCDSLIVWAAAETDIDPKILSAVGVISVLDGR